MKKNKMRFKSIINYLMTVISWCAFIVLLICAAILIYYYISMQLYIKKGNKYKPAFSIYTIMTGSMVPEINVRDIIINTRINSPEDIKVGDVITFISSSSFTKDMTMTHRVVDINIVDGNYEYTTKGDANQIEDSAPAKYSNVIGRAVIKLPKLGNIQFFVASKLGWLIVVIIPALYIIIKDVYKLIKITRIKKDAEKVNNKMINNVEYKN